MKKRNYWLMVVTLVFMTLFVVACSETKSSKDDNSQSNEDAGTNNNEVNTNQDKEDNKDEQLIIRIGHENTKETSHHKGAEKFKEIVEEQSNGEMKVEIYPQAQLGQGRDALEGNVLGTIEISISSMPALSSYASKATALAHPYVIKGEDERSKFENYKKLAKSDIYKEILDQTNEAGLHFIQEAVWWFGDRHITSNKPIETPDDVDGLKIRTPDATAHTEPFRVMGANVTPMPISDAYMALNYGTIDAQENPINIIYTTNFHEVQDYVNLTGHLTQIQVPVISLKWWQTLTPEQQSIINDAMIEAGEYQSQIQLQANEDQLELLKENGMEVIEVDQSLFKEATKNVYESFGSDYSEEFYQSILSSQ